MRLLTRSVLLIVATLFVIACDENDAPPAALDIAVRADIVDGDAPVAATATAVSDAPDGALAHEVRVEWEGDETVILDDARFTHHVSNGGDLVLAGRGCGAEWDEELDRVTHMCTDDLQIIRVAPGESHNYPVRIYPEVPPLQLTPGTYVVDERVRWWLAPDGDFDSFGEEPDGAFTIRLTYEVE